MIYRRVTAACFFLCAAVIGGAPVAAAQNYEAQYEELLSEFSGPLLDDTAEAQVLVDKADELYKRIRQHRRDSRDALSAEESDELRDLYREVRDFKGFVRVVGQLHNAADTDIDKFEAAANRLGLKPRVLQTHTASGLELVRVDIASFGSILVRNPTPTTYTLRYSANDPERPGGIGSAACESYSVMSGRFNSRDRKIEDIQLTFFPTPISSLTCD